MLPRLPALLVIAAAALLAVPAGSAASAPVVVPWPEADNLFRQDPRWLGSDDAYSVDLGGNRILWLFADTFVAETAPYVRRHAKMIRNSVAIQQGTDPLKATMRFHWARDGANAGSFFSERNGVWYWPGDGVLVDGMLLVFLMKVRAIETGLRFEAFDWTAVAIDNPGDEPPAWHVRWLDTPSNPYRAVVGSGAVLRHDEHLYAFGSFEGDGKHDVCFVRWPAVDAARGDLTRPQWWDARRGDWVDQAKLTARPPAVFTNAQTEFTVHFDPARNRWIEVQARGFFGASIAVRTAPELTGPWSELTTVYHPPESDLKGVMVYAGKAHPELKADGLVLTYAVNAGWERVLDDPKLYYPRFLRMK